MLSINTNLAGLIAQNSMKTSTDKLNQAIERMTTGLKINHASDNAANYSISTNLTTQLSAYDVAADNVAMGMDLVSYASDIISQMQDKAARLNALSTQARNGTYGAQSLSALNSEASAIMSELMRLYSTAEYNDISLFNRTAYTIASHLPQAGASGFIDEIALVSPTAGTTTEAPVAKYDGFIEDPTAGKDQAHIESLRSVTEANGSLTGTEYKVASVDDLVELARLVNIEGVDTTGKTFYLTKDLDIGAYCEANMATGGWTPIGDPSNQFKGVFDGNGHVIKNLKIDRETSDYQGLFGYVFSGEIKNVGLENVDIKGKENVGGLAGFIYANTSINNSYVTGSVVGTNNVGGFIGALKYDTSNISNCYAQSEVYGIQQVGGLVGEASNVSISNSYATGDVNATAGYVGGLVGNTSSLISNSYATGNVSSSGVANYVGGLAGLSTDLINNCHASGNVVGNRAGTGGLAGYANAITNSYATGDVTGNGEVGGLAGSSSSISNSYATGNVSGQSYVGGLAGSSSSISNSYATGNVSGTSWVGGLAGSSSSISNSYATGNVTGNSRLIGGLAGYVTDGDVINSYALSTIRALGDSSGRVGDIGGLVGAVYNVSVENCYAKGEIITTCTSSIPLSGQCIGGLAGTIENVSIDNCYSEMDIIGKNNIGGLVGNAYSAYGETNIISDSVSYSKINCQDISSAGSLVAFATITDNGTDLGTLNVINCQARPIEGMNTIARACQGDMISYTPITYDLSTQLAGISEVVIRDITTNLQVGIYGNDSCQLNFDTNFAFNNEILAGGIESVETFNAIVAFENLLSEKATQLGAVQNRLDSALESIEVNINNLTSSRSTIRDADIAEVSSHYIQQQILQQASATLMATANQAPSIALQLI